MTLLVQDDKNQRRHGEDDGAGRRAVPGMSHQLPYPKRILADSTLLLSSALHVFQAMCLPAALDSDTPLLQDNTKDNPASKVKEPQHFSKTVGGEPCQQLIVQLDRKPEVDNPGALSA